MNSCKTLVNFFNLLECFLFQLHKKNVMRIMYVIGNENTQNYQLGVDILI